MKTSTLPSSASSILTQQSLSQTLPASTEIWYKLPELHLVFTQYIHCVHCIDHSIDRSQQPHSDSGSKEPFSSQFQFKCHPSSSTQDCNAMNQRSAGMQFLLMCQANEGAWFKVLKDWTLNPAGAQLQLTLMLFMNYESSPAAQGNIVCQTPQSRWPTWSRVTQTRSYRENQL